ncbi:MAG TPA: hypothetical protein VNW46_13455 [Gemmatimonadaceae bacterium]|nr:hypothetical protein [Gemmatimonadaceae bacterium]
MRHWPKHILSGGGVALLAVLLSCEVSPRAPDAGAGAGRTTSAAPGASTGGVIAAGTNLGLASVVRLCPGVSRTGDAFTATVTGSVMGSHGAVIPVGSVVVGHIVDSRDSVALGFDSVAIAGVASYPLAARIIGRPQTVPWRMPLPSEPPPVGFTVVRTRIMCIPERGRITIQLVEDIPLGR